jgi:hypothetical protein
LLERPAYEGRLEESSTRKEGVFVDVDARNNETQQQGCTIVDECASRRCTRVVCYSELMG